MTRRGVALALGVLLLGGVVATATSTQTYQVADVGPGVANGINASSSVVGSTTAADGSSRAFLWTTATQAQTDLGIPNSYASDVNDDGVVVGAMTTNGVQHAFRWANGVTTDLGTLSGFDSSAASGVNASGQVVGSCNGTVMRPFLWDDGTMTNLGTLGGSISVANAINDDGTVVGWSWIATEATPHAFVWDATNGMQSLGDLDGTDSSVASDVNEAGDIVGYAYLYHTSYGYPGIPTATLWRNGIPMALDNPGGYTSTAVAVNDATDDHGVQVVGAVYHWNLGLWVPYLWEVDSSGQVTSLPLPDSLDSAFTGTLGSVADINDAGHIAGSGSTGTGSGRAFILSPSSEPPLVETPPAPSSVTATAGVERVSLSWSAVTGADTYVVARGTASGGPYQTIASGLTQTSYADTSAPLGATSHYVVAAVNGTVEGALSADVAAAPLLVAPSSVTATAGAERVSLSWSAVNGAVMYVVKRGTASGGPYQTIASGLTQASYVDTLAPLGATYHYIVAGANGPSTGTPSNDIAAAPLPYAPTGLTGTAGSGKTKDQVALRWTASASSGITRYKVFRIDPSGGTVQVATLGTATSYTVTGLSHRTTFGFFVTAVHAGGQESARSNVISVRTQ